MPLPLPLAVAALKGMPGALMGTIRATIGGPALKAIAVSVLLTATVLAVVWLVYDGKADVRQACAAEQRAAQLQFEIDALAATNRQRGDALRQLEQALAERERQLSAMDAEIATLLHEQEATLAKLRTNPGESHPVLSADDPWLRQFVRPAAPAKSGAGAR